jgi:hypothetical protein
VILLLGFVVFVFGFAMLLWHGAIWCEGITERRRTEHERMCDAYYDQAKRNGTYTERTSK